MEWGILLRRTLSASAALPRVRALTGGAPRLCNKSGSYLGHRKPQVSSEGSLRSNLGVGVAWDEDWSIWLPMQMDWLIWRKCEYNECHLLARASSQLHSDRPLLVKLVSISAGGNYGQSCGILEHNESNSNEHSESGLSIYEEMSYEALMQSNGRCIPSLCPILSSSERSQTNKSHTLRQNGT